MILRYWDGLYFDYKSKHCLKGMYPLLKIKQITGQSEHSQIHVNAIINMCQSEVARYDFESENDTDLPISPDLAREILNEVCANDCSGRGTCQQGK